MTPRQGPPSDGRMDRLLAIRLEPVEVAEKAAAIYRDVLGRSDRIRSGNFEAIGEPDLRLLLGLYDSGFFGGLIGRMLAEDTGGRITLRLSGRLTRAAGRTIRRRARVRSGWRAVERVEYEIAVSTLLLSQSFADVDRPVVVAGLACRDRLEALQRVFEHELLHLAEFLAEGKSSCTAGQFRGLARAIFGHEATVHDLVTPREVAARAHSIRAGDLVSFEHGGTTRVGRVNRITKRATVLVEDDAGRPYSDGRRYATFYVPIAKLRGHPPALR